MCTACRPLILNADVPLSQLRLSVMAFREPRWTGLHLRQALLILHLSRFASPAALVKSSCFHPLADRPPAEPPRARMPCFPPLLRIVGYGPQGREHKSPAACKAIPPMDRHQLIPLRPILSCHLLARRVGVAISSVKAHFTNITVRTGTPGPGMSHPWCMATRLRFSLRIVCDMRSTYVPAER